MKGAGAISQGTPPVCSSLYIVGIQMLGHLSDNGEELNCFLFPRATNTLKAAVAAKDMMAACVGAPGDD